MQYYQTCHLLKNSARSVYFSLYRVGQFDHSWTENRLWSSSLELLNDKSFSQIKIGGAPPSMEPIIPT